MMPTIGFGPRLSAAAVSLAVPALLLLLWHVTSRNGWVSPLILPPPGQVLDTFIDLAKGGEITAAFLISLKRIAIGFGIGASLGLVLGAGLGLSRPLNDYFGPTLKALSQVPTIGWVPILLLVLGLDEIVKYIIIAKATFILVLIATSDAIRDIPQSHVDAMKVLRLKPLTRLVRFWIPASLPGIVVGLRLGLGSAWIALVIVEMLAAAEGVGYLMIWGRTLFQLDILIVGMALIGLSGLLLDQLMALFERRIRRKEIVHG